MISSLRLASVVRMLALLSALALTGALIATLADSTPAAAQTDDDDGAGDDDDGAGDDDDGVPDNDDDGVPTRNASRLAGENRILTSIVISQSQFSTAATVYLANGDGFADALAGGVLTDGPILLVPSSGDLPAETCAEITRLDPTEVVALGGSLVVSDALLSQAAAC